MPSFPLLCLNSYSVSILLFHPSGLCPFFVFPSSDSHILYGSLCGFFPIRSCPCHYPTTALCLSFIVVLSPLSLSLCSYDYVSLATGLLLGFLTGLCSLCSSFSGSSSWTGLSKDTGLVWFILTCTWKYITLPLLLNSTFCWLCTASIVSCFNKLQTLCTVGTYNSIDPHSCCNTSWLFVPEQCWALVDVRGGADLLGFLSPKCPCNWFVWGRNRWGTWW